MIQQKELIGKSVPCLDQGFVQLIDMMPHPTSGMSADMAIVNAARTSFLGEGKGDESDRKLLFYLMKHQHVSPFEMVEMKFLVYAPLVTYWQWARHRTFRFMSINSQSGRYTPFEEDAMYVPDEWRKQSSSNKQGSDGVVADQDAAWLSQTLSLHYVQSFERYQDALSRGVSKELARLFLPGFSMYYRWVISIDASNLMNFLRLRMASDAQHEIRVYADVIYDEFFKPALPWTAQAFEQYVLIPQGIRP